MSPGGPSRRSRWRTPTAIPHTTADPSWTPLLTTPNFPEYPSGHSTVSGAAATVLARFFGNETSFTLDSDVMLGVTRSFPSFSAALDEVADARVFAGIHYRTACVDGQATGTAVANYILENSLQPIHGILAVVASAAGAGGSFFKTAVGLHNPNASPISGTLIFRRQAVPGSSADPTFSYTLAPYETLDYADFMGRHRGRRDWARLDLVATGGSIPLAAGPHLQRQRPGCDGRFGGSRCFRRRPSCRDRGEPSSPRRISCVIASISASGLSPPALQ